SNRASSAGLLVHVAAVLADRHVDADALGLGLASEGVLALLLVEAAGVIFGVLHAAHTEDLRAGVVPVVLLLQVDLDVVLDFGGRIVANAVRSAGAAGGEAQGGDSRQDDDLLHGVSWFVRWPCVWPNAPS